MLYRLVNFFSRKNHLPNEKSGYRNDSGLFPVGAIVRLRSGSREMVVSMSFESDEPDCMNTRCTWMMEDGTIQIRVFPEQTLELVE